MALPVSVELQGKRILCVGLVCLDVIVVCKSYPEEDTDQRCLAHRWQQGGNAANNCTVLKQLGVSCEYLGTMSTDYGGLFLKKCFIDNHIEIKNCVYYEEKECPTSYVLINAQNGSRTILHSNNNLPELNCEEFKKINLKEYNWIHFQGRNVGEICKMIQHIQNWNENHPADIIIVSVELEKARTSLRELLDKADLVFIEKDFVKLFGIEKMETAVQELSQMAHPGSILICPWGDLGACAYDRDGKLVFSPAYPPSKLVDTLGAGDTFVAACIMGLRNGQSVEEAVILGCKLAGAKCGLEGYSSLANVYEKIKDSEHK
ncbi:ketohexokinase-like isoform X1 [Tachypleus tridentatus]|uniref:ketohexokinase-like isoform X1 n=1 Tax=Tachypleus tridentatus TaxID=6853 RepID=UPI003FD2A8E5